MNARFWLPSFALLLVPAFAHADAYPDFNADAKPILAQQPGLIEYIHAHFEVKETGIARIPGSEDSPPQPPFIFNARPRGHSGPFYLALLIQPGPPGHIMKVADVRKLPLDSLPPQEIGTSSRPPATETQPTTAAQSPAPSRPLSPPPESTAPASAPSTAPTSDTPTGVIQN